MRTTTVVRDSLTITYPSLDSTALQTAVNAHLAKAQSVLATFATAHGTTSDNETSFTDGDERAIVRSWPDLATAQAWVDLVLSGALEEGLDYPPVVVSAQVNPE